MKNTLETRLGMFFALALVAAVIVLEMSGGTDFFKPGYHLRARFKSAQELKVGDPVKMAGKTVGRVEAIDFAADEPKVEMVLKIDRAVGVKTDSKATIRFAGLMGQNFISINLGAAPTKFEDGQLIQAVEQADLSEIMGQLSDVAKGVEKVTQSFSGDSIQNILGPFTDFMKQNQAKLATMIGNMQFISQQVADGKGTVGKLIHDEALYNSALDTVKTLQSTATNAQTLLTDAQGMMGDMKAAMAEAKGALADARGTIKEINEGKGTVGKLLKDETLANETTTAMTNLREILEKINRGQGSVGKLVNDESFFKNAKMTLQKLDKATEGLEDQGPLSVLGIAVNSLF
jgi:phospholipid/cholesterol/gamma-HCH transport system substrate-binding protein